MKILLLSTFQQSGGAAIAAKRLFNALKKQGAEVRFGYMLQSDEQNHADGFSYLGSSLVMKLLFWINFIIERVYIYFQVSKKEYLYKFTTSRFGVGLISQADVKWAEVIHIHWTHFGMLSLESIAELSVYKKVVWTFHDFWGMTGGCFSPLDCRKFEQDCNSCFYLKNKTLAQKLQDEKIQFYKTYLGEVVLVSSWLKENARTSKVLRQRDLHVIGNTLDLDVFQPLPNAQTTALRQNFGILDSDFVLLAGAANLNDTHKGFQYVLDTLVELTARNTGISLVLLTFGKSFQISASYEKYKIIQAGMIGSELEMRDLYNIANCYVQTSAQEILSYTAMESLACGTPVAAFDSGGIRDLIKHDKTGGLVNSKDVKALVDWIQTILGDKEKYDLISKNGRNHVVDHFGERAVSTEYLKLYGA